MLILNGLRIATGDGDGAADVVWRTERVDSLPAEPGAGDPIAIVRGEREESGIATDHIFGYDGRVRCRFRIAPDGSAIACQAIPEVSDRDLFSLFAEPVMRTILVRRGLLSFHAAALATRGRSILIMAAKGAGKSTLSWALQEQGWELLADDLARVDLVDGRWSVFPGHRQTKLTPAAARAFGHSAEAMPVRFDDAGPAAYAALFDKRIIDAAAMPGDPAAAVPLAALVFLTARDPSAAAARIERLSPPAAVRSLLEHATPDPPDSGMAVPPDLQRAVGGLATQVEAVALTLPDRFDLLADCAATLEPFAAGPEGGGLSFAQEPDADLSPVGSLALLWPALPDGLVSPAARARLEAAAARLAPVARIALELRLGDDGDEVDLHQFVSRSAADAAALKRYLSDSGPGGPGDAIVRRFLTAWADDSGGVRTDLDGFFLEWDGPGSHASGPPAIFLPVQGRHDRAPEAAIRRRRVAGHIERLGLAGGHVAKLLRTIPAELSISYVGFMLGRGDAVRVNLRAVRPDDLARILAWLGWPGDAGQATALFGNLVGLTGQVALALDFAPAIQPAIGFECVLPHFPAEEPRWRELFDWLCADGLCTQEKRAGLERVGARLYPEDEGQEWPASWIAAAVVAPPHFVPWYERRLSHVKVSVAPDGEVGAKAYVSAQHQWSRAGAAEPPRRQVDAGLSAAAAIEAAAGRAADFLIAERQQDDFWRDFQLVNGASDEWVTAFVGFALVTSGVPLPADLLPQTVRALLRRQRPEGGWGYNRISPADSDSTTWALKFLRAAGYSGPEIGSARAFLLSHLRAEGGLSTYAETTGLRFGGIATDDSGWRSGHLCVAANAAGLIGEPLVAHLLSSQEPDGAWPAYWWRDDILSTALATESLAAIAEASESRSRAAAWARRRAASASTAFDRAWLIRIFSEGGTAERAQARTMALALAAEQPPDGGWDSSAEMLFPDPAEIRRHEDVPIVRDQRRLFTAASALIALGSTLGADE